MNKEKQIEEMADVFHKFCEDQLGADFIKEIGVDFAEALYNAGYRKQEWISVMDELPETYTDVLYFDGQSIGVDFICSDGMWCDEEVRNNKVTHWMPLPEAPKMKGGAK